MLARGSAYAALIATLCMAASANAGPRWYVHIAGGAGRDSGEMRFGDGDSLATGGTVGMLRFASGAALTLDHDIELRIGAALDLYPGGMQSGGAGGPELEVNKALFERCRGGVRIFGGIGGDGTEGMVGLRLHSNSLALGIDAVTVRGGEGAWFSYSNGVIASLGVEGREAKILMLVSAGVTVIAGALVLAALTNANYGAW